jgi:hypothetical protein
MAKLSTTKYASIEVTGHKILRKHTKIDTHNISMKYEIEFLCVHTQEFHIVNRMKTLCSW